MPDKSLRRLVLDGRALDYELERKAVRNLNLRVRSDGSVHVSVPRFTPLSAVESFLRANAARILRSVDRAAARPTPAPPADGARVFVWGAAATLRLRQGGRPAADCDGRSLTLTLRDPADAAALERALARWYRREAEETLTALCRRLYPRFAARGVPWPELRFRRMRSRWGSCRARAGVLTFNTRLAELPLSCAEYVAAHELCHFLQPNHSPAFYAELARVLPDWAARRRLLRRWEADLAE